MNLSVVESELNCGTQESATVSSSTCLETALVAVEACYDSPKRGLVFDFLNA